MRVLVACEFSQVVCKAFRDRGHEAYSCDILPTEGNPDWHIQDDVLKYLAGLHFCPKCGGMCECDHNSFQCHNCRMLIPLSYEHKSFKWDMMIAHPDCTKLANSGLHYLTQHVQRRVELERAFEFIKKLWDAPIDKICIENPTGWLNTHWYKPSQIIQPYYFGEDAMKTTCLWLKNLPILMYTGILPKPQPARIYIRKTGEKKGQVYKGYHHEGKTAHERSRTFKSIAEAMATQWGSL